MLTRKIVCLMTVVALNAIASLAVASEWNYGCKGALPVFNNNTVIIFNRYRLLVLPKAWLKAATSSDLSFLLTYEGAVIEIAEHTDWNSGLAPNMVFTHLGKPDQKLTLTEKSSKTISDDEHKARGQPRYERTTIYKKVYRYASDFGYLGPFDVKMDCINYELSAPIR